MIVTLPTNTTGSEEPRLPRCRAFSLKLEGFAPARHRFITSAVTSPTVAHSAATTPP